MIFKIWLDTRPKMETHDPNVYPTILGGVSRGFWTPFLDRGARSAIFWHLKTGTFGKSARGVDMWVMRFHFRASIKPIFESHVFRAVSGPFHPLYETKISNRSLSVVYGSITLKFFSGALGTNPHQWFNRRNKI